MTDHNEAMRLAEWLRQNSSGVYRPAAEAADLLTRQAAELDTLRAEVERLRVDGERWGKFIGLSYQVRAEWAANLSLVPVLTSWVDSLPANDTARKATQ